MRNMESVDKRIALLIDADNAPASKIGVILAEVARHGTANVRRAYGNWKSPHLKQWEDTLHTSAIRPMQQFAYSTGKNASDMAMVVDAMDLLHSRSVDAFAIVSSDADFTPLVMRIIADGAKVYGFGQKHAPEPFVSACSQFTYVEGLIGVSVTADEPQHKAADAKRLRSDTRLVLLLRNAVAAASGDGGWANLAHVGNQVRNQASFDERNYGYRKLVDLVDATELFEIKRENQAVLVKDKRKTD
ncbi:MAG: NYN domain-containing protein [Sporichthyaceae bacterium]